MALMCAYSRRFQPSQDNPFSLFNFSGKCGSWYKFGVDIFAGNIVWINGPYVAGKHPNIKLFCSGLAHLLDKYERVEAEDG